jgi:uncharacterized membrane protein YphA (DoxX/SURF4 family)
MARHARKTNKASLLLRSGLAIVLLYAATSALVTPQDWVIYLPHFATTIVNANTLIKLFAIYELVLAGLLISGKFIRWVGVVSALIFASLALVFIDD